MHSKRFPRSLRFLFAFLAALLYIWTACRRSVPENAVVARVGRTVLTREDMQTAMEWEGVKPDQESDFVDRWVSRELLYQKAKTLALDRSEELDRELELVKKEFAIQKLLEREFAEKIKITEDEITSYYERNKDLFEVTEDEIRLHHILTKTSDEASLARQEIISGGDFEEVARKRSVDSFREVGGNLGFVKREALIDELSRPAFSLSVGEVSRVISSPQGFHLLTVDKKYLKGSIKTLEEVRNQVIQRIHVTKERSVYHDLIYQLQEELKPYVSVPRYTEEAADSAAVVEIR